MKFQFLGHSVLFYISVMTTLISTILISYAIHINGFVQPWTILGGMNLLGYVLIAYIYITE